MKKLWRDYSLSIVLFILFLGSWIGQFFFQLVEAANEAKTHGEEFAWSDFWPRFGQATFENWQSEFLQLLTFVVLTAYLMHRGSPESRDSDDQMQASLARIEKRLDGLEKKSTK
jgi:hypothetical protein